MRIRQGQHLPIKGKTPRELAFCPQYKSWTTMKYETHELWIVTGTFAPWANDNIHRIQFIFNFGNLDP